MIITRLLGGLGNQMFQYAAGIALAHRRRTVLKLDVDWFKEDPELEAHNRYALGCLNVCEQFATREEIERLRGRPFRRTEAWLAAAARLLRLQRLAEMHEHRGRWLIQSGPSYADALTAAQDATYIDGMWQSEKCFGGESAPIVRQHFTFRYPAPAAVEEMAQVIRSRPSAFVHFRRGDYERNATFREDIGVLGLDYYRRAEEHLLAQHPDVTLFVFSDDIDAVERAYKPKAPCVFVRCVKPWHAHDKIRLMSLCGHGIISNSTFAWWGAWLGSTGERTIIAPDPWLAGRPSESSDVVCASWKRLAR